MKRSDRIYHSPETGEVAYAGFRNEAIRQDRRHRKQFPHWDLLENNYRAAWIAAGRAAQAHIDRLYKEWETANPNIGRAGEIHSLRFRFVYPADMARDDNPAIRDQLSRTLALTPVRELEEVPSTSWHPMKRGRPHK